jgi:hypothetical protein
MNLTLDSVAAISFLPGLIGNQGIVCHVNSNRNGGEETCYQVDGYVDFDVHIDIHTDAIIQHKACTWRWTGRNTSGPTMVLPVMAGQQTGKNARTDHTLCRLSSSASLPL